ncbi:MAG: DUF3866 family protein [Frankiaceae bacterium]
MIRTREGRVLRRLSSWPGAVELVIEVAGEGEFRGLAYPKLVGTPDPGDTVLVNTTAVALGLGTGGYLLVIAILSRPAAPAEAGPGHLVKARYLPLQPVVLGLDEEASPHREAVLATSSLDGIPVVIADLHSALPAIVAGVRADRPDARVAYVMTDGGALPAWFSRTLAGLSAAEWLVGVVTAGQCFGGTLEAVTVHSGMLACRAVLRAEVIVVTQGPGNLGTASPWSFTGVAAGEAVNAAHVLGGRPVASLRISGADPRARHYGLSHHSSTSYGLIALAPADVVVPADLPDELTSAVRSGLPSLGSRHRIVDVDTKGLMPALHGCPVRLTSMGRGLDTDPAYFLAAAAAGRHAARLVSRPS